MGEPETTEIKLIRPRREWLLHCNDRDGHLTTCSISVSNGDIDIYGVPEEGGLITLQLSQIAEFHLALHEAISLAETDLQAQRQERAAGAYQA